jgi:hypothetical protein
VAWALLSEATSAARLETHRLRHLATRGTQLINESKARDHIHQVAGDLILSVPRRLEALETHLDRLSYALSVLGTDHLRERLPMSDRALVDEATHRAKPFSTAIVQRTTMRVADRYLAKIISEGR